MATNREKINKMTNKKLATKLAYRDVCSMCIKAEQGIMPGECNMYGAYCEKFIEQWLSQETEEETAPPIMNKALMKVDERMARLEQRINENRIRIDKLEEEGKVKDPKDFATCDIQLSG